MKCKEESEQTNLNTLENLVTATVIKSTEEKLAVEKLTIPADTETHSTVTVSKSLPKMALTFRELIESDHIYVDKTEFLANLIRSGEKCFILLRPRRFGKSLLLEMIECYFQGERNLFTNLYISNAVDLKHHFKLFPVLKLDFSMLQCRTADKLEVGLIDCLNVVAFKNGITLTSKTAQTVFRELIVKLATKKENVLKAVVILIDEYEVPFRSHASEDERKKIVDLMKTFYATIKASREYIHFCLVTGITNVEMADMFSGLNHASLLNVKNKENAAILGFTEVEIKLYFDSEIRKVASALKQPRESIYDYFRKWYNGFRFTESPVTVYNPCSVILYLKSEGENARFFSQSGGSSYLHEQILQNYGFSIDLFSQSLLSCLEMEDEASASKDSEILVKEEALCGAVSLNPDSEEAWAVAFYQIGLLTIRDVYKEDSRKTYSLTFSNKENQIFYLAVLLEATEKKHPGLASVAKNAKSAIQKDDWKSFVECTNAFLASFPHTLLNVEKSTESVLQFMMYVFLDKMRYNVELEKHTLHGFADLVAMPTSAEESILIFEFKIETNHTEALQQCERYVEQFLQSKRTVYCIAMQFSRDAKKISKFGVSRRMQNCAVDRIPYTKCDERMSWSWSTS